MNAKEFRKQWFDAADEDKPFELVERIIYLKSGDIILSHSNFFKIEHRKETGDDVYFYGSNGDNTAVIKLRNIKSVHKYDRYKESYKGR